MKTILLAEDNGNIREYCRRELEDEGYRIVAAGDGFEALRIMQYLLPDLIVLDLCMPGLDGLETARRIKALRPDVPIVFFTSFDEICIGDKRSLCADACVEKQEDLTELKRTILAVLGAWGGGRHYRRGLPPDVPVCHFSA